MQGGVGVLRILVADEQGLFRSALKAALEADGGLAVVAEAGEGEQAVAAAEQARPDVAILSTALPTVDGVRASCMIRERLPDCRIIVLAPGQDQRILADGLGCGANGYMTKDSSLEELVAAVHAVARGETLIPPTMLSPLLDDLLDRRRQHENALLRLAELSPREREVLALVARGAKTSAIAEALVISSETARTHIQNILSKLDVHSRLEAASFVIENGLLDHLNGRSFTTLQRSGGPR